MAHTRAQAAAQRGLTSPASKGQETRPQSIQSRNGATKRAEPNCIRPSTISETSSRQSRGRKQPIEIAVEPRTDRQRRGPKRQRTSPTRPAGNTVGELLSRKRGIDGPAESNLPRAKRVRTAKALEHVSQERAISDHADFHSSRENLAASAEGEGEKQLHAVQDSLDHTPDGSLSKRRRTTLSNQEAGGDTENWRNIIDFWRREGSWPEKYFEPDDSTRKDFERESEDSWLKEMERYDPTVKLLFAKKKTPTSLNRKRSGSDSSTTPSQDTISASYTTPSDQRPREEKNAPYRDPRYPLLLQTKGLYMGVSELGITDTSKQLIRDLLSGEQSVPKETLFDDDIFVEACYNLETKNEARIIQDISRLIVPSAESLALRDKKYRHLIESVNEGWNNSIPLTTPRPQPDYSVGFRRDAFTED
ncbi:hypothetical protein MYCTH_2299841 [Thermothelomyces thermophilus ATCC 42464]|uniref:DUF7924 domain-containing protein n=1 Tax=Thermothelomyces thermophilus (strain ATCC 42464 / BCRC 31852 / DSM 1799) TaxID=573729 RepID=G2Q047_THET4|nr:uncharacterized protein MYCTH_2299841 [Thermothelomyces thermophilus ATCC 42464]AEO55721.1 hypothetical protein MYCTH_2299841 [Thermothelomyces thermophilus ATCC 42464]